MWQCLGDNADLDLDVSSGSCAAILNDDEVEVVETRNGYIVICPYCGSECVKID